MRDLLIERIKRLRERYPNIGAFRRSFGENPKNIKDYDDTDFYNLENRDLMNLFEFVIISWEKYSPHDSAIFR